MIGCRKTFKNLISIKKVVIGYFLSKIILRERVTTEVNNFYYFYFYIRSK